MDDHWDCGEDWEENDNALRIHKDKAAVSKMHGFHTVKLFYLIDIRLLFIKMISWKAVRNQLFISHDGGSNDAI